jgi:predicted metal-binding membrane protein
MVIPLVVGVIDMRAMLVVASGITAERLAPHGQQVARVTGVVLVAAGGLLLARVVGP